MSTKPEMNWGRWAAPEGAAGALHRRLLARIQQALTEPLPARAAAQPCVDQLLQIGGGEIDAVLFYGSCLFDQTRARGSFPDFYVLVRNLDRFHRGRLHAVINRVLPPNVYYASLPEDRAQSYKYCVMSTRQFRQETSPLARDIHHLGRFSKRVALAYSRDDDATEMISRAHLDAMLALIPLSLCLLPPSFELDQLILQQLGLSYLGEQRVAEPEKVHRLMSAALPYYRSVYADVLELYSLRFGHPRPGADARYHQPPPDHREQLRTQRFLKRSRVRGVLRWPKYILTVDNWVDYLLAKLERHHGVRVELTPRQRRYPLIFAWPVYFEMRRRGIVK